MWGARPRPGLQVGRAPGPWLGARAEPWAGGECVLPVGRGKAVVEGFSSVSGRRSDAALAVLNRLSLQDRLIAAKTQSRLADCQMKLGQIVVSAAAAGQLDGAEAMRLVEQNTGDK